MKFCYVDESGHKAPIVVVAGIVVDALRMRPTKAHWNDLLAHLNSKYDGDLREIKGGDLHRGNGFWRRWPGEKRAEIIEEILAWMNERKHTLTFGAVCKDRLFRKRQAGSRNRLEKARDWSIAALHLVLGIQKRYQGQDKNKGHTVFVFDRADRAAELVDLVLNPPPETDGFYCREQKREALDQIVDVPYFADSRHAVLIQVADFYAYILRLHADLSEGHVEEKYKGEQERVAKWVGQMGPILMPRRFRWPSRSTDPCAQFLREVAPPSLLDLG